MKLIRINLSHCVIVENTHTFNAGDWVLINCSELNIENDVRQIIEFDYLKHNVDSKQLVFGYNKENEELEAIDKEYCQKIIYSTKPLNGVKFLDIDYARNMVSIRNQNITISHNDLIAIIKDFQIKRPMSVECFVDDYILSKHIDKDMWDVEIINNYPVLIEKKDAPNHFIMEKEEYDILIKACMDICDRNNPSGNDAKDYFIAKDISTMLTILHNIGVNSKKKS